MKNFDFQSSDKLESANTFEKHDKDVMTAEKIMEKSDDIDHEKADEIYNNLFEEEKANSSGIIMDEVSDYSVKKADDIFDKIIDDDVYDMDDDELNTDNEQSETETISEENPRTEVRDGVTYYYDDNGKLYRVGNELAPNSEYEINGYKYKTDEKGRIISAEGKLHLKDREGRLSIKDSIEDIGKGDQKDGDDRGHLIGDQFDGSNGLENMIPQDADINRKDFRDFESDLAKYIKEGKEVYVKIEPIYEGDSRRPVAIVVSYSIDGKESVRLFPNGKEE